MRLLETAATAHRVALVGPAPLQAAVRPPALLAQPARDAAGAHRTEHPVAALLVAETAAEEAAIAIAA
jgi:hypothetical protein